MSRRKPNKKLSILEIIYLTSPLLNIISVIASGTALAIALSASTVEPPSNPQVETSSPTNTQVLGQSQQPSLKSNEESTEDDTPESAITPPDAHTNTAPDEPQIKPVLPHHPVPESQLWGPNYPALDESILGKGVVTGGFMEELGHSHKPTTYAIFSESPDHITTLPPSPRNLGFDYVIHDYNIRNWYPGTVTRVGWEDGYGNRAHVLFDAQFSFNGTCYPLKGAYAHAHSFSVKPGDTIEQGQVIGRVGGTGGNYPDHVDFRLWIEVDGKSIDVSPNVVDASLFAHGPTHHSC